MTSGDKNIDQSQGVISDSKSGDTGQKIDMLKNRAPKAKTLPAYVTQQVSKSLVRAINQGENSFKIQLKPPELGRILLTIQNNGNSIRVSIMTENQTAKDILGSNVHEIKTILSNSGVTLEDFEVDMNSNFRQSMADAKNQARSFGKRNKNKENGLPGSNNGDQMDDSNNLRENLDHDGAMHFVA